MKELRCMVVDDEPLAVKMLENFISKTSFLSLEASFTDPVAALEAIRAQRPQLVFLDIQMPDLNGMELSRMVPPQTRVVFTTAFKQYAFDSYEVSALDFLLKPIRYQKFLEAAEKALRWFELLEAAAKAPQATLDPHDGKTSVFVKSDGQFRKVEFSRTQIDLNQIQPSSLEPYPGPFLRPGITRRVKRTAFLRSLARPNKAEYRKAARAATREATAYAEANCGKYFEFQRAWPEIMRRVEGDRMLSAALMQKMRLAQNTRAQMARG